MTGMGSNLEGIKRLAAVLDGVIARESGGYKLREAADMTEKTTYNAAADLNIKEIRTKWDETIRAGIVDIGDFFFCAVCDWRYFPNIELADASTPFSYCPGCGRKIDDLKGPAK